MPSRVCGPRPWFIPVAWCALLLAVAVAGCTSPGQDMDPLLQESVQVGRPLFDFGEAEHFGPQPFSNVKRINATFDVEEGLGSFGVSFQGLFNWANSSATLRIDRPDGSRALLLEARRGLADDEGEIASVFQFYRVVQAESSQDWLVVAEGEGNISALDFRLHGIEVEPTEVERGFVVDAEEELRLRLELLGWGSTPTATLVAPDGDATPLELVDPRGGAIHDWSAVPGEYQIHLDTSGWGGGVTMQVHPV